jgi:6-pyruvoyltetrahydropterin/6-carboxytetrahydropterin synthase
MGALNVSMIVRAHFDAAHQLKDHPGKCAALHGHRWEVSVELAGKVQENGMLGDFAEVKATLEQLLPDHTFLNEYLAMNNPTAEAIGMILYCLLYPQFQKVFGLELVSLSVAESPGCSVRVTSGTPAKTVLGAVAPGDVQGDSGA